MILLRGYNDFYAGWLAGLVTTGCDLSKPEDWRLGWQTARETGPGVWSALGPEIAAGNILVEKAELAIVDSWTATNDQNTRAPIQCNFIAGLTPHDRAREKRAHEALSGMYYTVREEIDALEYAAIGLQSTDAPGLVHLYEAVEARLATLKQTDASGEEVL